MRPGPIATYLKMLLSDKRTFMSALDVGLQHVGWSRKHPRAIAIDQAKRAGSVPA
jgi:hypothetical protein